MADQTPRRRAASKASNAPKAPKARKAPKASKAKGPRKIERDDLDPPVKTNQEIDPGTFGVTRTAGDPIVGYLWVSGPTAFTGHEAWALGPDYTPAGTGQDPHIYLTRMQEWWFDPQNPTAGAPAWGTHAVWNPKWKAWVQAKFPGEAIMFVYHARSSTP